MRFKRDFYEILDIACNATPEEIKQAYYKLVKLNHPDTHQNDPAAEWRFKEIAAAYKVLSDPVAREKYHKEHDHSGHGVARSKKKIKQEDDSFLGGLVFIFVILLYAGAFEGCGEETKKVTLGQATIEKILTIPGLESSSAFKCIVSSGELRLDSLAEVLREGSVIASFKITSLRSSDGSLRPSVKSGEKALVYAGAPLPIMSGDIVHSYRQEAVYSSSGYRSSGGRSYSSRRSSGGRSCSKCSSR